MGGRPIPSTDELISRQTAFFSQTTIDGVGVQAALSQARVVLVGAGYVADHTVGALMASGMKSVCVQPDLFSAGMAQPADCVLVCMDSSAPAVLDTINSAALQHGWPWIAGRIESGIGMIGPTVIPRQTACYRCFELRRHANLARPDHRQAGLTTHASNAAPGPMAAAIAGLLGLEAMRLISRLALPQTMGAVLTLDFFATGISSHRVLRLPNCPDCGYGRPCLPEVPAHGM